MKAEHVVVLPYEEAWKFDFEAIKHELEMAPGNSFLRIEHAGSTSMEGEAAKPVIDIDIVIADNSRFNRRPKMSLRRLQARRRSRKQGPGGV